MDSLKSVAAKFSPFSVKKSVVDGKELEHVFFVAGGMGFGEDPEDAANGEPKLHGGGGGGISIPLGAYSVDEGRLRLHPNPVVLLWTAAHLTTLLGCVLAKSSCSKDKGRGGLPKGRR